MSDNKFSFDKFMQKFNDADEKKRHAQNWYAKSNEDNHVRKLNKLYGELWQNRMRWR